MKKNEYIAPVVECIETEKEDIIRTSSGANLLSADYGNGSAEYSWSNSELFEY